MASTQQPFDKLTPIHPRQRITLETGSADLTGRVIDLFVPLGFGQRALIVAPPKAGKTTILRQIAASIRQNFPETVLFLCLVDERPEEVTEWRSEVQGPGVRVYASSFDQETTRHGRIADLALREAKHLVGQGQNVVVLLDSLTRLARAHNLNNEMWSSYGSRTLSGGIDAHALEIGRRLFGSARALEEGGSLTIVASCLVETGSKLDEVVYEEFKGTGNLELRLSRELADRRIFPAIDLLESSTRQEERLLSPDELRAMAFLRRQIADRSRREGAEQLLRVLEKTKANAQLVAAILKQGA